MLSLDALPPTATCRHRRVGTAVHEQPRLRIREVGGLVYAPDFQNAISSARLAFQSAHIWSLMKAFKSVPTPSPIRLAEHWVPNLAGQQFVALVGAD